MKPRDGAATRNLICEQVRERPGIHKSELCRALDLAWGTVTYHLRLLEKRGQLRCIARGRQVNIFPAGVPELHMRWLSALREDIGILPALADGLEAKVGDLSSELGLPRRIIRRHLANLEEDGFISKEGPGRIRLAGAVLPDLPLPALPRP